MVEVAVLMLRIWYGNIIEIKFSDRKHCVVSLSVFSFYTNSNTEK